MDVERFHCIRENFDLLVALDKINYYTHFHC